MADPKYEASSQVELLTKNKLDRKAKTKKVLTKIWKDKLIYLMILPVVVYYAIFRYLPMAWLGISFYDFKILRGFSGSKFVGFKNFVDFFSNPNFFSLLYNTIILNVYSLLFCFTAPIIFALLLNELRARKFKRVVQTVSYLQYYLSIVFVVVIIYK